MESFGPPFRTTARDRANRMASRTLHGGSDGQELSSLGQGGVGGSRDYFLQARNSAMRRDVVERREGSLPFPPPANSTHNNASELFVNNRASVLSAVVANNSLMDLDNDLLEQVSHIREDRSVDIVQSRQAQSQSVEPDLALAHNSSAGTQYAEVGDCTGRPSTPNPARPNPGMLGACSAGRIFPRNYVRDVTWVQNQHQVDHHTCQNLNSPQNQVGPDTYHTLHAHRNLGNFNDSLSTTDRTVILELIRNVPQTDASDELLLLQFLKVLMPLFEIAPTCSQEIIKLLLPKVSGPLFTLWREAISAQANWGSLHSEILDRFIPSLRRREIENLELERPQRQGETFAQYTEHLIQCAFALKTALTEQQIIEICINKCRPENRSYFSFGKMPENIYDLRTLASKVTSSIKAEARYFGHDRVGIFQPTQQVFRPQQARFRQENYPGQGPIDFRHSQSERVVKCFRCNQEGHMARNCRVNLN